jgi:hypothetical protein
MATMVAKRRRAAEPRAKAVPSSEPAVVDAPLLYETDYYLWCFVQADELRLRHFGKVDLPNVIEELESLGKSQRLSLKSSYRLLIAHLLKWQFQPQLRSSSWDITIAREREHISDIEEESGTLKAQAQGIVDSAYRGARREAHKETGLPLTTFPLGCPYTLDQLRDDEWMPK